MVITATQFLKKLRPFLCTPQHRWRCRRYSIRTRRTVGFSTEFALSFLFLFCFIHPESYSTLHVFRRLHLFGCLSVLRYVSGLSVVLRVSANCVFFFKLFCTSFYSIVFEFRIRKEKKTVEYVGLSLSQARVEPVECRTTKKKIVWNGTLHQKGNFFAVAHSMGAAQRVQIVFTNAENRAKKQMHGINTTLCLSLWR